MAFNGTGTANQSIRYYFSYLLFEVYRSHYQDQYLLGYDVSKIYSFPENDDRNRVFYA